MLIGKQNIVDWLQYNSTPFWRIKKAASGDTIATSGDENELSMTDSIARIEQVFSLMGTGNYYIESYKSPENRKNWLKSNFQLIADDYTKTPQTQISGITTDDIESAKQKAVDEYKKEIELQALRNEVIELRNRVDSTTNQLLEKLTPYVPYLIGALTGTQPAQVAGTPETMNENNKTMNERAKQAFQKWYSNDPDAVVLIEKISTMAVNNPTMYNTAKNILMNQ